MWHRYLNQHAWERILFMRRITMQKGILVLCYACIILGCFWFSMNQVRHMPNNISVDDYVSETDLSESDAIEPNQIRQTEDEINTQQNEVYQELQNYQIFYQSEFSKQLFPVILQFSLIFIVSSILFWFLMSKLQKKEKILIAKDLTSLKQYQALPDADPILKQAYETIQASYEQHFEDYKRLHSYVSHEQKNALALLQNNLKLHEYERCEHNVDHLRESIEDLLTISDSNEHHALYPVDLTEICANVCDDYSKRASISFDFDEDECLVLAKERWMYRCIANLVDNAIKYGKGNPIRVEVRKKQDDVQVIVEDHGIGIDPKKQEEIFQHHYRINELNQDGYGIGLSLVKHVLTLAHGTIQIDSKLDEGTTIALSFHAINNEN